MKQGTWKLIGAGVVSTAVLSACETGNSGQYTSHGSGCTEGVCSETAEVTNDSTATSSSGGASDTGGRDSLPSSSEDAGSASDTPSASVDASDAGEFVDASDGGACPSLSAVAQLPEGEEDYVVSGDEACVGNQGCTPIDEASIPMSCGNGGYHCNLCNDEVCVSLFEVVECAYVPDSPDAADGGDAAFDGGQQ